MFTIFTTKEILNKHREQCLLVNNTQAVKYETGIIKFRNFHKQKPAPVKIYADIECQVKRVNIKGGEHKHKEGYTKSIHLIQ